MTVFKAHLSTYGGVDKTSTASSFYGSGGHPFVGYTMITNKKIGNNGIFDSSAVSEYLQRNDASNSKVSGDYAVNLNTIYEKAIPYNNPTSTTITVDSVSRNKSSYLVCSALGRKGSGASFNHYLSIDDRFVGANTSYGGFPVEDDAISYTLPFSKNVTCSSPLYINFMAFGYCLSNTPYVGIGLYRLGSDPSVGPSNEVVSMENALGTKICIYGADSTDSKTYTFSNEGYGTLNTTMLQGILDYSDCSTNVASGLMASSYTSVFEAIAKLFYNGGSISSLLGYISYGQDAEIRNRNLAIIRGTFEKGVYIVNGSSLYKFSVASTYDSFKQYTTYNNGWNSNIPSYMDNTYKISDSYTSNPAGWKKVNDTTYTVTFHYKSSAIKDHYYDYGYEDNYDGGVAMPDYGYGDNEQAHLYPVEFQNYYIDCFKFTLKISSDATLFSKLQNEYVDYGYNGKRADYNVKSRRSSSTRLKNLGSSYYGVVRLFGPWSAQSNYEFTTGYVGGELIKCRTGLEVGSFNRFDYLALGPVPKNQGSMFYNYLPDASTSTYNPTGSYKSINVNELGTNPLYNSTSNTLDTSCWSLKYNVRKTGVISSSKDGSDIPLLGYVNACDTSIGGKLYVKSLKLIFEGKTTSLKNSIKVYKHNNTSTPAGSCNMNSSGTYVESSNITYYTISFTEDNSPAYVSKSTDVGMTAKQCGMHQLVRLYSYDINKHYINELTSDSSSRANQWNAVKIAGQLCIKITGSEAYTNGDNDIILVGAEVQIADNTSIEIRPSITRVYSDSYISIDASCVYEPLFDETDTGLVLRENKLDSYYAPKMKSMFLASMCGANTRYLDSSQNNTITKYYCDSSILSAGFNLSETKGYLSAIEMNGSVPVITCASYANTFNSNSLYTYKTFNSSSKLPNPVTFTNASIDIVDTNGTGAHPCVNYTTITADSLQLPTKLSTEFSSNKNIIRYKLPTPGLSLSLIYESVEFNGISAWTFTRSVPLNAASKARPHMLVYKVEAWLEKESEEGVKVVDTENTKKLLFCDNTPGDGKKLETDKYITEAEGTIVYSGYCNKTLDECSKSTGFGINHIDYARDGIINNIYLKYNDGHSTVQNAIASSFPITILTGSNLSSSITDTNISYYGGNSLTYEVIDIDYSQYITDSSIYEAMYNTMLNSISNTSSPVCICGCSCSEDETTLTKDGHKIIYLGIGFYNPCNEIMPINALFSIKYPFTTQDGKPGLYFVRIPLSHFFPTNSMMYMSGADRDIVNTDEAQKIRFISDTNYTSFRVSQNGLCDVNDISVGEVVNIGTLEASTNVGSEIHPKSLPTYDDDGYLGISGLYGIFNKFTGEVEYVANASSDVTSGNMTDVIAAKEAEGQAGGAYTDYVNFFNQIGGRCLTTQQEICLFPHAVSDDIPYII